MNPIKKATSPMIKIEHATKVFGSKVAVDDLSLDIGPGEIFAFLGPNGAGKTTSIKMLTGLLHPTSGRILIDGHDVAGEHMAAKRLIGYIPDEPYLYEKLTGREFMRFVARLFRMDPVETERDINALADLFSMNDYLDSLCEEYSHGMKQRVVIATALLHKPKIIIVDEPMVGLDPASARLVKDVFREKSSRGVTVFMSTHTLSVAEEIAGRIGIITSGRLRAVGSRAEIDRMASRGGSLEDVFLELTADDKAPSTT